MSVAKNFLEQLQAGNISEAIEVVQSGLREASVEAIEESRKEILESYGFVLSEKKKDKTYEEETEEETDDDSESEEDEEEEDPLDEAVKKETYTDIDTWKSRAKELEPKVSFREEGHGGSEAIIASLPGSPQMVGKFFLGGGSKTKGKGTIYNTGG